MKINDNSKPSMNYLLTTMLVLLAAPAAADPAPSDKPPEPARQIATTLISTQGIEADAIIDIGNDDGSTLKIVNGGVKLPDNNAERSN